ncbi:MAG: hypothetical protein RIQ81_2310 [Pseudomonadota bacterium]
MVRKLFPVLIAAGVLAASSSAFAARKYGMAGCGLGSIVMGKRGSQLSAATTNSTAYSQIFGITSGTSNCKPDKVTTAMIEQEQFLTANLLVIEKEMSQGGGETVAALGETFGCEGASKDIAVQVLSDNHDAIFANPGVEKIRDAATEALQGNSETAKGCNRLVM